MLMAPAIVNPDGNKDEDGNPMFPEVGDLTHADRPTHGMVTVDAAKQTVSIGQTAGIVPDITDIPVVKVGDLLSLMSGDNEWLGSHHARVINNKSEEAVVYTNVEGPGSREWTTHFGGTARPGVTDTSANSTTGLVTLVTDDVVSTMDTNEFTVLLGLIDIPAFPTGGTQFKDFTDDSTTTEDEGATPGTFMDIEGMFSCADTTCTVRTNADGDIATLGGRVDLHSNDRG